MTRTLMDASFTPMLLSARKSQTPAAPTMTHGMQLIPPERQRTQNKILSFKKDSLPSLQQQPPMKAVDLIPSNAHPDIEPVHATCCKCKTLQQNVLTKSRFLLRLF